MKRRPSSAMSSKSVSQSVHLLLLRSIWSHRLGHICPALIRLRDKSFLLRLSSVSARATFRLYVSSSSSSDTISQSFFHSVNQSVSGLTSGHQQVGHADSQSVSKVLSPQGNWRVCSCKYSFLTFTVNCQFTILSVDPSLCTCRFLQFSGHFSQAKYVPLP